MKNQLLAKGGFIRRQCIADIMSGLQSEVERLCFNKKLISKSKDVSVIKRFLKFGRDVIPGSCKWESLITSGC